MSEFFEDQFHPSSICVSVWRYLAIAIDNEFPNSKDGFTKDHKETGAHFSSRRRRVGGWHGLREVANECALPWRLSFE
jgi:hypothetical protein